MTDWKEALSALTGVERPEEGTGRTDINQEVANKRGQKQTNQNPAEHREPQLKAKKRVGVVYSTNPDYEYTDGSASETTTLPKNQQKLRLSMERAGRGGKTVTIVRGFVGTDDDLQSLAKLLKQKCGVGGAAKDDEIIIQGDHRPRIIDILKKEGYVQTK